jgi:hypothetical protein
MKSPILFLYTSYRTGGTSFASAFKGNPSNRVFHDPLNAALRSLESASHASSDNWNSNHPAKLRYFEEYLPLFGQGTMNLFPDYSEFRYRNSSAEFKNQLVKYLGALTDSALIQGKFPVLKLEQLKGHVHLLRENFPDALHVGLVRNPEDQFQSWLEQFALGNPFFFDNAFDMINRDAEFFKPNSGLSKSNPNDIFETFYSGLVTLRSELDFTHNLYEENFQELLGKINSNFYKDRFILAEDEFNKIEARMPQDKKFIRMMDNSLELIQQRDELIQQRDELIQQRDELMNSRIWKSTKPLRALINFVKR